MPSPPPLPGTRAHHALLFALRVLPFVRMQEVHLTDATRKLTPAQVVVLGDVERRLLMEECADLEARAEAGELDTEATERLGEVRSGEQTKKKEAHSKHTPIKPTTSHGQRFRPNPRMPLRGPSRATNHRQASL